MPKGDVAHGGVVGAAWSKDRTVAEMFPMASLPDARFQRPLTSGPTIHINLPSLPDEQSADEEAISFRPTDNACQH